tara:strand:- start:3499 stop:4143 length:645 start_codon:yes stop_codon:yes gene_type:complete
MILEVQEKDYVIPEKWTQVKLGDYQNYMEQSKDVTDAVTLNLLTISCFTGIPYEKVEKIRKGDVDVVLGEFKKLLNKKMNTTLNMIIEIDGVDYGFNPNLKDMTLGEFVDLDNHLEDAWKNMHIIMAILYRPITSKKKKKYSIEEYNGVDMKRAETFRDKLSIATVNGASSFFLHIGNEYHMNLLSSLSKEQKETMRNDWQTQKTLVQSGDGIQ